jgi:hypothetical protein
VEYAMPTIVLAALVLPGLGVGWWVRRTGRMRGALLVALPLFGLALVFFGLAANAPHDDPAAIGQVLLSFFVLLPAGLSALVGGGIGLLLSARRGGQAANPRNRS